MYAFGGLVVRNRRTGIRGSRQSLFSYLNHQVRVVGLSSSFFVSSPDPISMCNDTPCPTESEPQRPKSSHQMSWNDAGEYKFHQWSQEQHEITNLILQSISQPFNREPFVTKPRPTPSAQALPEPFLGNAGPYEAELADDVCYCNIPRALAEARLTM